MIEGYIGRPGSGKSYTLTERALREAKRGRPVFTNYALAHDNVWMFRPEQLLDLPPGLIVIDEAHLWFPARMSLRLPPSWLAMLSQTRKNGWDLLWCAQHESRVDRVLRDVSSYMHLCSAWFSTGGHPMFFQADCYEPEFFRRPGRRLTRRIRAFSPAVATAYDTYEQLTVAEHATSDKDVYANQSEKGRKNAKQPSAPAGPVARAASGSRGVNGRGSAVGAPAPSAVAGAVDLSPAGEGDAL